MLYGYHNKVLDVNLTSGKISEICFDEQLLLDYVGGRSLSAKILWDKLGKRWSEIDPLGPENLLLVTTGPLNGFIPGGRTCVSGKSPLSNGIVGSTVGGEFSIELRCSGYDNIVISGESKKPVYLLITDGNAVLKDAKQLWGFDAKDTVKSINHEVREILEKKEPKYGLWKEPALLYVGPAGEAKIRTAIVGEKWTHAAGFGGYGAVMGSKKLKAIVAKGTGPLPEISDPKAIIPILDKIYDAAISNEGWRRWGTSQLNLKVGKDRSAEPVRNWQEEWTDDPRLGVDQYENRVWVKKRWSDYGCPLSCLKLSAIKEGPYKGAITDNPDYELVAYTGPNLGIYEPEEIVYLSAVIDDLGYSGINIGNVLGFAAELYDRSIITKDDLDGIELKWGDVKAFVKLLYLILEKKKLGKILAEGTYRAAKEISKLKGVDAMAYAIQFKGMEVGAHGIRSGEDYVSLIGYALSTQSGDHTSPWPENSVVGDSLVYCTISYRAGTAMLWTLFKAVTGRDITQEDFLNVVGRRARQIQRAALLLGGPDIFWDPIKDDDNPPRWYEPLPSGPMAGTAPTREEFLEKREEAYLEIGWDEYGIPTSEELKKLGLEDVDKALVKLRKNRF